ncbi:restriction endonuclease subunit S [Undibacterium flavidum]|uniref:Restriction endonuclease subunit S n=1 Tax=Undibacterium flavidum TaxID=2762297 RepID=A0ABR6Y5Z9_9BURK|nr:restriction endonuclease subunit S [Undibacterium flavidum]MBC3872025.1 restriction endonuclease subunit S [Undibacterium flavidum]
MEVKSGYKKTEVGIIPEDWLVKKFSDHADFFSSKRIFERDYVSSGIPFYRGKEISLLIDGEKLVEEYFISEEKYESIKRQFGVPQKGEVLITAVGTLGNVFLISSTNPFYFKDGNLIWLRNIKEIDLDYFVAQIRNNRKSIISGAIGSSQKALTMVVLKETQFVTPSDINEQTAIANALSDADALIGSLQKLIAKKRQIKQGAMQTLFNPYENGVLKAGWEMRKLGDICSPSKNRYNPLLAKENCKCVELEHLSQGRGVLLGYVDSKLQRSQKAVFQKGDVLFGKLRPYLRKYWFAEFDGVCSTEIWVLKASNDIKSEWLYYLMQSDRVIEAANQSTGTKMPRAEWHTVKNVEIYIPTNDDQQSEIASILLEMDMDIASLETKLAKYQQIKQGMMQNLLTGRIRLV